MNEAPNLTHQPEDEEPVFWEAVASDALREIWDTPENEDWDTFYQQQQTKR